MKRQSIMIIGLGQFGSTVAKSLIELDQEVLGVDIDADIVQRATTFLTHAVVADATDELVLQSLELGQYDIVIVAIGDNTQANLMTSMMLKELNVPYVVSKAESELQGKMLKKIGVDMVLYPERDMAMRLAQSLTRDYVLDYLQLSNDIGLVEIETPEFLVGKTLIESGLRERYQLSVVAVKTGNDIEVPPKPNRPLTEADRLILIGRIHDIDELV
ncbi:MAG: TrkA family potassium uptake protein [Veillonella sp.]|mgnify:CR=1 FL=1|jgi:trk system potassium uptake protein TrkA|uniref:potassium channel family protein n=1 Tax=Veillonella sp. TaxID=1926307 RepID=UPI001B42F8FD|nr:TrkA family potassium uptake protein [Veillonella sp.]MBK7921402.1 TrkA family potassium uptake protein [Veillonella sp.]MBP6923110.1 TrkA family potassium uptake protein [Veillonella sp.]MBP8616349.1 TrkA family potassium uptake protein [Veillonella sp.]MBP9516761.1 TrkA family potassium uptake protein [Veillonella sp.]MBP9550809.1 TrkA family potassium uptake protein [Veillonella sp.]